MGSVMTRRSKPRPDCAFCEGAGFVMVTRDPDVDMECVCTDPPVRIQLSRRKGWRLPSNTVTVARPGRFGNPYKVTGAGGRDGAVDAFEWLVRSASGRERHPYPSIEEIRAELAGKNLACWCRLDQRCHADVLLEIANGGV